MKRGAVLSAVVLASGMLALALRQGSGQAQQPPKTTKVTFSIPGARCRDCVTALEGTLKKVKGIKSWTFLMPKEKQVIVEYLEAQTTVHQIAQAIANIPPYHGEPYSAALLLNIPMLPQEKAMDVEKVLTGVKGVGKVALKGTQVWVEFTEQKEQRVGKSVSYYPDVTLDQLLSALKKAGFAAEPVVPEEPKPEQKAEEKKQ